MILYRLHHLKKSFGARTVLDISDLEVKIGECCAILGDNGAGKSTLMRILAFLDPPSEGRISFQGQDVEAATMARFRRGLVWVSQFPVMFRGTVLDNVAYPQRLRGIEKVVREKKALSLLDQVKLAHLAFAPAQNLSGGEAQRVSIARALAADAKILFFDEPTANVDRNAQEDFAELFIRLRDQQGYTLFLTTHNGALAARLCARHIVLDQGRPVERIILPDGRATIPASLRENAGKPPVLIYKGQVEKTGREYGSIQCLTRLAAGLAVGVAGEGWQADFLIDEEPDTPLYLDQAVRIQHWEGIP